MGFNLRFIVLLMVCVIGFAAAPVDAQAQTRTSVKNQQLRNPNLQQGIGAYYAGDYQVAMRHFLKLAHRGDAEAQYYLAYMYDTGQGISQDLNEAARWYVRAAEQGYLPAEVYTGYIYATGRGTRKDLNKAKLWYKKAAVKGDMIAQNNLGSLLEEENSKQSKYDAAQWYLAAAKQGNPSAQFNLGDMYRQGVAIRQDLELAGKWYLLAALQGDKYAQNALGFMYLNGQGVKKDIPQAVQWYKRAAEQGLTEAQYELARLYQDQSRHPALDEEKRRSYQHTAAVWYAHAANGGHDQAAFTLAEMYRTGTGVRKDVDKAVEYLEKLVDRGYEPARLELAQYLERGEGSTQANPQKALQWVEDAAYKGDGRAMFEAGRMYYDGVGTSKNMIEGYKWFALAVENLPEDHPLREDAIIARVEVSNAMSAADLDRARTEVTNFRARN